MNGFLLVALIWALIVIPLAAVFARDRFWQTLAWAVLIYLAFVGFTVIADQLSP